MSDEKINQASADDVRVSAGVSTPEPEVVPKAERRRFSAEYKQRILTEADGCEKAGEIGALLRREGLYRSHLDKWRQQERTQRGLEPQKRGRKPDPQAAEIVRLRRENERLQKRLQQAETIIDVQKTLSAARSDDERERQAAMNQLTEQLAESQGVAAACAALGIPRSSLYRVRASAKEPAGARLCTPSRATGATPGAESGGARASV